MYLSFDTLVDLAQKNDIPLIDAIFIAINFRGVTAQEQWPRMRMTLSPLGDVRAWQTILAVNANNSPIIMKDKSIFLGDECIANIVAAENDDVVLSYIRGKGENLTLNTYSRSNCTGCVFCPNSIEESSDRFISTVEQFRKLFSWIITENNWPKFQNLKSITVCTGCFKTASKAIEHLSIVRSVASEFGFSGELHLLSSVIREERDLERAAQELAPFHLTVTMECFERRRTILKSTKADLSFSKLIHILQECKRLKIKADFTYIAGLDSFASAMEGLIELSKHVTTFPRIQVYQAHNSFMEYYLAKEARDLNYFFRLRKAIENHYTEAGLRPKFFENYRPLWYSEFGDQLYEGPFV